MNGVQGLKAFKLVQDVKSKRKLVEFFEIWESLHKVLNSKPVWKEKTLSWYTYHTLNHIKKAKKPSVFKSARIKPGFSYADAARSGKTNPKVKSQNQKSSQDLQKVLKLKAILSKVLRSL